MSDFEQKLESMGKTIENVKKSIEELEKCYLDLKTSYEKKNYTNVFLRFFYKCEDTVNKAKRGVFFGYIKEQELKKNNITYESNQFESVEEKLIIINECIMQILSEVEKPLFIIKDEKDYLLIKMCTDGDLSESMAGRYILQSPNLVEMVQQIKLNGTIEMRLAQEEDQRMLYELVH